MRNISAGSSIISVVASLFLLDEGACFVPSNNCWMTRTGRRVDVNQHILQGPGTAGSGTEIFLSGQDPSKTEEFSHADIEWKIRPKEGTAFLESSKWQVQANLLRLNYEKKNEEPPLLSIPPEWEQLLLEAWKDGQRVGRFGVTCRSGPSAPPIDETIKDLYSQDTPTTNLGIAAIIYMFCEPEYRGRSVGSLALEVISLIHSTVGCDYTVLVADDKSDSGTLVDWYERHGFSCAPKLQEFMGSPGGKFGVTMIAPTKKDEPKDICLKWW